MPTDERTFNLRNVMRNAMREPMRSPMEVRKLGTGNVTPPPVASVLLMEDGSALLMEDGSRILLEA